MAPPNDDSWLASLALDWHLDYFLLVRFAFCGANLECASVAFAIVEPVDSKADGLVFFVEARSVDE